jgi:hypothetical protein
MTVFPTTPPSWPRRWAGILDAAYTSASVFSGWPARSVAPRLPGTVGWTFRG